MTDFLFILLQLSVFGSLLAALLFFLGLVFRRWVSRTVFYYLWLFVLLRLCVPAGITVSLPAAAKAVPVSKAFDIPAPQEGAAGAVLQEQAGNAAAVPGPAASAAAPDAFRLTSILKSPVLWVVLWGLGASACFGWYISGCLRFSHAVQKTALEASAEASAVFLDLKRDKIGRESRRVQLAESSFIGTPMLLGALRPVILLPQGITGKERLRDILLHELTHARRHDLLYRWFAVAVTSLHWFNPLMVLVRREIGRACELSCDEAVVRGMDAGGRKHYGETLLALAASPSSGLGWPAVTLCEEKKQLKERLVFIVKYRKKGFAAIICSLLLALAAGGCALVSGADISAADKTEGSGADVSAADKTRDSGADIPADKTGDSRADIPAADETEGSGADITAADKTEDAMDAYRAVLLGEAQFLYTAEGSSELMDIAKVPSIFSPYSSYADFWKFAVVDLDGDGGQEVVCQTMDAAGDMSGYLILHWKDGAVYGFTSHYKTFMDLKTDGTYSYSNLPATEEGICRIRFTETDYAADAIISMVTDDNWESFAYFAGGEPVTAEAYDAMVKQQQEKPDAAWHDFTDDDIDFIFQRGIFFRWQGIMLI